MREQLIQLIESHNSVVTALENCDVQVPNNKVMSAMTVWHKLACEGCEITKLARQHGIDAKVDMQCGRITVHCGSPTQE